MNQPLKKYLRARAITSPWTLSGAGRSDYQGVIVIPALAEAKFLPHTLTSLAVNPEELLCRTLVIVVVNNRPDASMDIRVDNQSTLYYLEKRSCSPLHMAWVDASSRGREIPHGDGVGLARKIGFDLALSRLDWNADPLLVSLDADSLVDCCYLPALFAHFSVSAQGGATLPFRHQSGGCPEQEQAIRAYELYLRSYLFGLQQAGSPYAYHTIGSTFACRAGAYVAAGGMNRRTAGEDFYFLQQLAKVAGIDPLAGTLVRPSSRPSARVSFGTGPVIAGGLKRQPAPYRLVSAESFQILKDWLGGFSERLHRPGEELLRYAGELSPVLRGFLEELGFLRVWCRIAANHADEQRRLRAFHHWFDALRTRQLLTRLEGAEIFEPERLVAGLLGWAGAPRICGAAEQLAYLECLQGVRSNPVKEAGGGPDRPFKA